MNSELDIRWVQDFGTRYEDAWNSQQPRLIEPLVDVEIRWRDPALPQPATGLREVQEFFESIWRAFPDHHIDFLPWLEDPFISADGGACAVSWQSTGTFTGEMDTTSLKPTNRSFHLDGIDLWRFRNGRLWTVQSFYDLLGFCRQIGVLPARGSATERIALHIQGLRPVRLALLRKGA